MVCPPAIAATAYFVAVILLDLYNRRWKEIPGHALFGVFAVLLLSFICERASETVAWILLGAPLGLVLIGYAISVWFAAPADPPSTETTFQCPCCSYRPCRCHRPCWKPRPCPRPEPKPEPKPKPDNCIQSSLADD